MATPNTALRRLQQAQSHLEVSSDEFNALSVFHGPSVPELVNLTLGGLLDDQCRTLGDKECLVVSWTRTRWTYSRLRNESRRLAKGLLSLDIHPGDRIGILAGNCEEYVAVFFASAYIGAILVVLNSTYTAAEAQHALRHSGQAFVPTPNSR